MHIKIVKKIRKIKQSVSNYKNKIETLSKIKGINTEKVNISNDFVCFNYKFEHFPTSSVNLGDYIQTLAVKNVLSSLTDKFNITYEDRDSLSFYNGKNAVSIMQGWFGHSYSFLPNSKIYPIWIGTHITPKKEKFIKKVIKKYPEYFKNTEIGCRDENTKKIFNKNNVKSYLSRCLTLTFPKRDVASTQNKVFIVDIKEEYLKYIPNNILNNAVFVEQREIDKGKTKDYYLANQDKYFDCAYELLNKYKNEAKLIITSALHCASPCTAMGIPVVLIDFERKNARFSALQNIIKIYTKDDLINKKIDYNIKAPDIESLKSLMIKNVQFTIDKCVGRDVDEEELNGLREAIENYKTFEFLGNGNGKF